VNYATGEPEFAPDRFAVRREIGRFDGAEIIIFKNLLGDEFIGLRLRGSDWTRSNNMAQRMERGVREPNHEVIVPPIQSSLPDFNPVTTPVSETEGKPDPPQAAAIIDEVGYLTLDPTQASLLFQIICQRYENQQAIILTSNKAFADWSKVFADDAVMASAALDRLLHHSTVINIRGQSYRLKEKRQAGGAADPGSIQEVVTRNPHPLFCPSGSILSVYK
jgi:hypothetical protein